jgi:hypothetical protein
LKISIFGSVLFMTAIVNRFDQSDQARCAATVLKQGNHGLAAIVSPRRLGSRRSLVPVSSNGCFLNQRPHVLER